MPVYCLLNGLINRNVAESGAAGPLHTELTIEEMLVHIWMVLLKCQHLTPVQTAIPAIVWSVIHNHPREHATNAGHVQIPVFSYAGTDELQDDAHHLDVA